MLFPERRFGLVNNSNNLFDYLFSDPVFNVNTTTNRMSTDIKEKEIRNKIHESLFFFGKIGQNSYIYANIDRNMNNYAVLQLTRLKWSRA